MRNFWNWLKGGVPTKEAVRDDVMRGFLVSAVVLAVLLPAQLVLFGRIHVGPNLPGVLHKPPAEVQADEPATHATGWIPRPDMVAEVTDKTPFKRFSDTPAGKAAADPDLDAFLWKAWTKVGRKKLPAPRNQKTVGSCTGFGITAAIDCCLAIGVSLGHSGEYKDTVQENIYGGLRVQIGKGRLGSGDGGIGAWGFQYAKEYGVLPREKVGNYDLTEYSEERCRQWGAQGVPAELLKVAMLHPVKDFVQVKSAEEARKALLSGYPIGVCSNQGFTNTRDADGFARPSGSWAHCMSCLGYRADKRAFWIWNSWNGWNSGPLGPGEPPDGGFWCDWDTFDRMCRAGDTFACADVVGFGSRRLSWFVSRNPFSPEQRLFAFAIRQRRERP